MKHAGKSESAADTLGRIGLPASVRELRASAWDVIIVGAGHNGLACAAYLAQTGKRVLVLEARERIGGACTVEEPWPGVRVGPCAYLAGLLHPVVIEELNLPSEGFKWTPASNGMFIPFEDLSSIQLFDDDEQCEAEIRRFAPADLEGWRAMGDLIGRVRKALRPPDNRDLWLSDPPTREQIEERIGNDREAQALLFTWSMADFVDNYLTDERLRYGYLGQGVIGTNASPFDSGTAYIRFHHASGRLGGLPGAWGYVKGGVGMVSFYLCDIARKAGATVAAGVPVARILPGEGVILEGGEHIAAPIVVSNADPRTTLKLLGGAADQGWRAHVESIPIEGCTLKLNVLLKELPNFRARPGTLETHHRGQINTPLTRPEWKAAYNAAREHRLPNRLWTELYFQSVHDRTVVPDGFHVMSVFAQYVPYRFADGDWEARRDEVSQVAIESIARFCTNLPDAIVAIDAAGPPDIERKVGLTGGHIFQGECLPAFMWSNRLSARTPMPGVYLCGAGTHPGGSVIAANGRNAARAVLQEEVALRTSH
jgi:phytoene dehydrogenase-like protein